MKSKPVHLAMIVALIATSAAALSNKDEGRNTAQTSTAEVRKAPSSRPATSTASTQATRPAPQSRPSDVVSFPLAQAPKLALPELSLDELAKEWTAFRHEPFDAAGFNHLTLPFRYEAAVGGDGNEALAFSFLLSHAIDWAPGCYCTRHAYFTFKRAERYMRPLAKAYDWKQIAFAVKDWDATHAVGGSLRKGPKGYSGTLEIYDAAAKVLVATEYKEPREYFTLLGDMAVDAIQFFGHKPSKALVEHLHKRRCSDFQSILDLGSAAFVEEKSKEEFGIYERILQRDPHFAEVRYWWANQKQWGDGDRKTYFLQSARSMQDYLTASALSDFDPETCPDPKVAAQFDTWLAEGDRLVGKDSPLVVGRRLKFRPKPLPEDSLQMATEVARTHPNGFWLLYYLAQAYEDRADSAMAASIYVAAAQNRYLTGDGTKKWALMYLTRCLSDLGVDAGAHACMVPVLKEDLVEGDTYSIAWDSMFLARSLARTGWHGKAIAHYRQAYHGADRSDAWRDEMLLDGGISAAMAGRQDVLSQILRDRRDDLDRMKMTYVLEAYLQTLQGQAVNPQAVDKQLPKGDWDFLLRGCIFCAQIDLMSGQSRYRTKLTRALSQEPGYRPLWILFDLYDRREPRPDSASFYNMVEWLHPDDAWVRQAVADYRRRVANQVMPTPDELLDKLKDYAPVRWPTIRAGYVQRSFAFVTGTPPGCVPASILALLRKGHFEKAEELALRYHHLAVDLDHYTLRGHANWLIHLVQWNPPAPEL